MFGTANDPEYLHPFDYIKELQHAFIFLPLDEGEAQSVIAEVALTWVLRIGVDRQDGTTLSLNNGDNLILEKTVSASGIRTFENISYVVRTSGTTGQSRFVRVEQYCIDSNVRCLSKLFNLNSNDTIYFGTPLTFDPSMIELLLALRNGACLLITHPKNQINPRSLYQTLFNSESGITVLQIVPSVFHRWSADQISNILLNPSLRILAFGGECFPVNILKFPKRDGLRIFNLYGITEISCWATIHEISGDDNDVPVGVPLDDTIVKIKDDFGNDLENREGEIYIGSSSRLCLIDNEQKHLQNSFFRATGDIGISINEKIYYRGRKNDVFKRFGFKIHLSEIEELVLRETSLENKCIWAKSESKLLLFLINENFDLSAKDKILDKVRIKLLHSLPKHYFPDYVDVIRKCPVSSHGKTDKESLISVYLNRNKPSTRAVVDIFRATLCRYFGLSDVELSKNRVTFFEIGGNSLLAVQFVSELESELDFSCPSELVAALFEKDLQTCLRIAQNLKNDDRKRKRDLGEISAIKKIRSGVDMRILWTYDLEACVDSTPLVFESRSETYVAVGSFSHIFVILNASSGAEIAKFALPDVIEGSPCISSYQNALYVGCFDGNLYCLDFSAREIKWSYSTSDRIKCTPILCLESKAVAFGSYDKYIHCIGAEDGRLRWKTDVHESVTSAPILEENRIFVATICGTCVCLSEINGQILWQYKSGGPIFGAPCALSGAVLWPKAQGAVLCLDNSGTKMWELECGAHLYSSLVRRGNAVIFGLHNGHLNVLRVDGDGPKLKSVVNLGDSLTTPCATAKIIVVAGNSGCLFLVNWESELVAHLRIPGKVFSSPKLYRDKIYVGCRDNHLYCIEVSPLKPE